MVTMTRSHPEEALGVPLPGGDDEARWQALEIEIALEQLKVLDQSMALTCGRIEQLEAELRMLPWNCARAVRDARLALGDGRNALALAQQQADAARAERLQAADELAAAEARLAPATPERRSRGLGLLMRRRRHHDGALLDLRMTHALASERLQAALDQVNQAGMTVDRQQQTLTDLLTQRRRQRSILIGEIEALERQLRREQAQHREYAQIVAEFDLAAATADHDSLTPA